MNWLKRKSEYVIPNPRDKRRRQENFDAVQGDVLLTLKFFVFALALLILAVVSQ